jgi:hypothetical protein
MNYIEFQLGLWDLKFVGLGPHAMLLAYYNHSIWGKTMEIIDQVFTHFIQFYFTTALHGIVWLQDREYNGIYV